MKLDFFSERDWRNKLVRLKSSSLQAISFGALQILCLLCFVLMLGSTISFLYTTLGFTKQVVVILLSILALTVILGFLLSRYINKKLYIFILLAIAFGVRLVWILKVDSTVKSDFALMYQSAIQAAKGDYSFGQIAYYQAWVYQLGFTMYEALVIKIFGNNMFILKLLNVLYSVGTTVLVYKIAARVFNESAGKIAGIVYATYMPSVIMCSVLTNQHLATFLFYLGFYLLVSEKKIKFAWIYIGILLALADIMRPLGSLVLLAVGIFLFLTNVIGGNKKQILATVKSFAGIVVIYFLVHMLISQLFISMDVTKYPISNRDPLWKFVLGLNHETTGRYSDQDASYVGHFPIGKERNTAELNLIKERIADKHQLWELIQNKFALMWGGKDDSVFWSAWKNIDRLTELQMYKLERVMFISIVFYAAISLISLLKHKAKNNAYILFVLLILGYVSIHLFIEIQTRYRYFIIPSLVIIQSYGIYSVYRFFTGSFKRLLRKA